MRIVASGLVKGIREKIIVKKMRLKNNDPNLLFIILKNIRVKKEISIIIKEDSYSIIPGIIKK